MMFDWFCTRFNQIVVTAESVAHETADKTASLKMNLEDNMYFALLQECRYLLEILIALTLNNNWFGDCGYSIQKILHNIHLTTK